MVDELKIYSGEDTVISDHIRIRQPTLGEIRDYGESDYFSMLQMIIATPSSLKVQLWDMGVDYTEITPYELFCSLICKMLPHEKTSILFGDLDFAKFELMQKTDDKSMILCQDIIVDNTVEEKSKAQNIKQILVNKIFRKRKIDDIVESTHTDSVVIDEYTYKVIMENLCKIHYVEQDKKMPANNSTKIILIEDTRDEMLVNKNKPRTSQLKNLISAMTNSEGFKYNHSQVWDMKINAFMDSVKRISKIKDATLLLQSGYSGYGISLKDISKKQLNWLGDLE